MPLCQQVPDHIDRIERASWQVRLVAGSTFGNPTRLLPLRFAASRPRLHRTYKFASEVKHLTPIDCGVNPSMLTDTKIDRHRFGSGKAGFRRYGGHKCFSASAR